MARKSQRNVDSLSDLPPRIERSPSFAAILDCLRGGASGTIDGAWGSSCALVAGTIARNASAPLLIVVPRIAEIDDFAADLACYLPAPPLVFPAWEGLPDERSLSDEVFGARLRVLDAVAGAEFGQAVIAPLPALLQPVPAQAVRESASRRVATGDQLDTEEFITWLVDRGFERVSAIETPGQLAVHGGIVDVFAPGDEFPVRIELFGDEVDSLRTFDPETQRKVDVLRETQIRALAPVAETAAEGDADECAVDSFPAGSWVVLVEPEDLVAEGRHYLDRLENPRGLYRVEHVLARCAARPSVTISAIGAASFETTCRLEVESIERLVGPKTEVFQELESILGPDESVLIACHNEGEQQRLAELLEQGTPELAARVTLCVGTVSRGFRLVADRLAVVSDHELFGRTDTRRGTRKQRPQSRAIDSFLDLAPGDLVVHLAHGIGRFLGMEVLERGEGRAPSAPLSVKRETSERVAREEHLVIEFRDGVRVFVPASLIHLVQKYVGAAKSTPKLSKLGGTQWGKQKRKVADAVGDLAADMLQLQAERQSQPGMACPEDSHLQHEFEAAFPFVETDDQVRAIAESKGDLELPRPMDRLICGDVGFGKTEVAMRAAFKVVDAGRQVAVLVPTTVLAEQHLRTFCERMAEYPIVIEGLSRFRTKSEQKDILARAAAGRVDILIGTHRLIQADVRFADLGLVIIDEEQRFGVEAKELLKQLRLSVDVLTLSATPIPRTLHMSLLGIRDISNLTTPPQDRMSIETRVCHWSGELIRHGIVRELNRGGQIYFVHNRVYNIGAVAEKLQEIVPEARIGIVHGQMAEHELEENMVGFVSGRLDILVATTIIESGLDIPNANTMFIHQADKYGLADLHQLRGRVGRSHHRAYCYLILEEGRQLTRTAARRLKAIEEFTELGAGFQIAMRDLEIRGAGNILGTQQSGHIATVGYELYCQLLENAVRREQGQAPREVCHVHIDLAVDAYLPNTFVPPGRGKIDAYRRLSALESLEELETFGEELRDRFGPLPPPAERLLAVRELQLLAFRWGVRVVRMEEGYAVFEYEDAKRIQQLAAFVGKDLRVADHRLAFLVLPILPNSGSALVDHLRSVLR